MVSLSPWQNRVFIIIVATFLLFLLPPPRCVAELLNHALGEDILQQPFKAGNTRFNVYEIPTYGRVIKYNRRPDKTIDHLSDLFVNFFQDTNDNAENINVTWTVISSNKRIVESKDYSVDFQEIDTSKYSYAEVEKLKADTTGRLPSDISLTAMQLLSDLRMEQKTQITGAYTPKRAGDFRLSLATTMARPGDVIRIEFQSKKGGTTKSEEMYLTVAEKGLYLQYGLVPVYLREETKDAKKAWKPSAAVALTIGYHIKDPNNFGKKLFEFINPSLGVNLAALPGKEEGTNIGAGLCVLLFSGKINVGRGWDLSGGDSDDSYWYIGLDVIQLLFGKEFKTEL